MNLESIAEWIVNKQIKNPVVFLMIFAAITIFLAPGILNLVDNVEPSLEKVLPQNIEEVKTMNDMRSEFGADMMYLLVHAKSPVYDVRNPELLKYVDALSEKIRTRESVIEVNNLADLVKDANNGVIPDSIDEVKDNLRLNPFTPQYVNPDYSIQIIQIRTDTGSSAELIRKIVDAINDDIGSLEALNPGSEIEITGFNAIDKATFEIIISDFGFITIVSMILVMLVVLITFRSLIKGMLPMIVVMTAIIWTMGIAGYLGFTITVVSMVSVAMIMGLGIDFGIHVVHNYFELRKNQGKEYSIKETMRELLRAMAGASLTTMAGFLALLFGVLPAMKTLGIILAIGILNTLIGAVFLLPVIVYLYDNNSNNNLDKKSMEVD